MNPNFKKKILDNGMTILFEKRDLPVVSVAFAVKNGGINESLEEKGISHFIEHMLYKGTETRNNKQIAEEIEKNGGELNGFTSEEITAYWCKMPSKNLNIALDVLSDVVKNPKFDETEFEKERQVIFEEIKMRRDTPQVYVFDEIQKYLYSGSLSVDLIGTYETMNSVTREQMKKKFKEIYVPENMFLTVVGNADFDEIVKFAEENFSKLNGKILEQELGLKNEIKIEKRPGIDQANLIFAHHIPLADKDKNYTAKILNTILAGGMSSRLFSEIREKRNLAYAVKGDSDINKRFAYNFIYVGTTKDNVEKVKELILEEYQKVANELEEKELQEAKRQLNGNFDISMEDSQDRMVDLLKTEICCNAEELYEFKEKINSVNLEDVKKMASEIKEGSYSFFALIPSD